ncbi:hypothetical protein [Companilactobacillus mishanensis]|uniref:hypothetical protein n=1 Tax=Companilactobacillus mishanensis TaxID=2486008 RepID=UPI0012950A86|nr:hypothetical protein [Companilactobacillus mishanensis]MQS89246.1 hypothetical protein [Companilactobacillus mishanensis]
MRDLTSKDYLLLGIYITLVITGFRALGSKFSIRILPLTVLVILLIFYYLNRNYFKEHFPIIKHRFAPGVVTFLLLTFFFICFKGFELYGLGVAALCLIMYCLIHYSKPKENK